MPRETKAIPLRVPGLTPAKVKKLHKSIKLRSGKAQKSLREADRWVEEILADLALFGFL